MHQRATPDTHPSKEYVFYCSLLALIAELDADLGYSDEDEMEEDD
jgi:hypothetical protein